MEDFDGGIVVVIMCGIFICFFLGFIFIRVWFLGVVMCRISLLWFDIILV